MHLNVLRTNIKQVIFTYKELSSSTFQTASRIFLLYLLKRLALTGILGKCWEVWKLIICLTRIVALFDFPIMLSEQFP